MGFNPVDLALGNMRAFNADNDRLRKENAKLRDGYGSMSREHSQTVVELSDALFECDRLKAENAKLRERVKAFLGQRDERLAAAETRCNELRELLREMLMDVGDYAEKYGIEHSCGAVYAHLDERLRALGIETS